MSDDASEVFDDWTRSLAEEQHARKASLEDRALNVIKNAAALVGLLFALIAFITERDGFEISDPAKAALTVAVVLFTASGVFAILTNAPRDDYVRASAAGIEAEVERRWGATTDIAHRMIVRTRLDLLKKDTLANDEKAKQLMTAIVLEVAGVAAVAVAVIAVMLD